MEGTSVVTKFDELYDNGEKVVTSKKRLSRKRLTKSIRMFRDNIKNKIEEIEIENEVLTGLLVNNTDSVLIDERLQTLFNNTIDLAELQRILIECEQFDKVLFSQIDTCGG